MSGVDVRAGESGMVRGWLNGRFRLMGLGKLESKPRGLGNLLNGKETGEPAVTSSSCPSASPLPSPHFPLSPYSISASKPKTLSVT